MTPKEALKGIKLAIAKHLHEQTGVSVEKHFEYLQYDTEIEIVTNALNELEALKKPPTVDEVCEALRGELKWLIIYDEKKKSFCHIDTANLREIQAIYMRDNKLYVSQPLSPSTITLIGRFYEGLEVEE